jgi:hypothetical protein
MKKQFFILSLLVLPAFVNAQTSGKCPDIVFVLKEASDNFQNAQTNLTNYDAALKKAKETSGAVHLKYFGCEKEPGVTENLRQVDDLVQAAESDRKNAADVFAKADAKIRQYITESHGRDVENFYTDPNAGLLGQIVTTRFKLDADNKVVFQITRDLLQTAVH